MSVYDDDYEYDDDGVITERRWLYWGGWSPLAIVENLFPTQWIVDIVADFGSAGATKSEIWHGFGWRKLFTSVEPALGMLVKGGRVYSDRDDATGEDRFFIGEPE